MEVGVQLHIPAALPTGKNPVLTEQRLGITIGDLEVLAKRKISCPLLRFKP
jgi:hypothetical protein